MNEFKKKLTISCEFKAVGKKQVISGTFINGYEEIL